MAEDIIDRVFSFISGDNEPNSEKQAILRQILRNLSQNKYAKFYRMKTEEVDGSFPKFLHDIFRIISPVMVYLKDSSRITRLQSTTLELYMDKETLELARKLTVAAIEERAQKTNSDVLAQELMEELTALTAFFTPEKLAEIDESYLLSAAFIQFARFDFQSIFQLFDSAFSPAFGYQPKFTAVRALNLTKELEAFQILLPLLNPERNWQSAFTVIRACCNGVEPIPLDAWINAMKTIWDVHESKVLEYIVQITLRDPIWQGKPVDLEEHLGGAWLEAKKHEIHRMIDRVVHHERSSQIEALAIAIFGVPEVSRLRNYSIQNHVYLLERDLIGFTLASGLNYLMAFLVDCLNRDTQDFIEQLLIRGQWSTLSDSREMSEAYYQLKDKAEEILAFDETLSNDGKDGARLKNALNRLEREKSQIRYLNTFLNGINDEAQEIIDTTMQLLTILDKHFNALNNDMQRKSGRLTVLNWRELGGVTKLPVAQLVGDMHKKFSALIELMGFFKNV